MVWIVDADAVTLGVTYTVPGLCELMSQPHHPLKIGFPFLGRSSGANELGVREKRHVLAGSDPVRSIGLLTCASVIYAKPDASAFYVYHANAGDVPRDVHETAVEKLGNDARTLFVAYAHNKDFDNYDDCVAPLISGFDSNDPAQKVPTTQVVRIKNLRIGNFGVNGFGWLGY